MLPKMRNEKCKKKREWYMKWVLEVSHRRNKEREKTTLMVKKSTEITEPGYSKNAV